jgi:Zn ribbon nucleic-acid-binding protein
MTKRIARLTAGKRAVASCALMAMSAGCIPAIAAEGGRYVACPACAPQDTVWTEGEFDQVYLVLSGESTQLQPQQLSADTLARVLAGIRYGNQRLLDDDAAVNLAQGLSKALAKAGPQQEAIFMITSKSGGGLFGAKLGNSGRAFVDRNGLNLIFGEAGTEFLARYRATRMERPFDFGSRSTPSKVVLSGDGLRLQRPDWLVIPLAGNVPAAVQSIAAPMAVSVDTVHPALPAPVVHDQQYYAAQEERLKSLKRLHEQNLITEQEYQAKRSEILKAW